MVAVVVMGMADLARSLRSACLAALMVVILAIAAYFALGNAARTDGGTHPPDLKMPIYRAMFPDLAEQDIAQMFAMPYRQVYAPWVGFRTADIDLPYVHVRGFIRATKPATSGPNPIEIALFGGSTMHGVHVPDDRTLPAFVVRTAANNGAAIHASNYGQPYYYLKQEAMLFFSMLVDGYRPAAAIFLDGLNDLIQRGSSYDRTPIFSRSTEELLDRAQQPQWRQLLSKQFVPVPEYDLPNGVDADADRAIAQAYTTNVRRTSALCTAYAIACLFVLQPVPFLAYDRSNDPLVDQRDFPAFASGYPLIKRELAKMADFLALDEAFSASHELPYVDAFHYSPHGNKLLAQPIYARMMERLNIVLPAER